MVNDHWRQQESTIWSAVKKETLYLVQNSSVVIQHSCENSRLCNNSIVRKHSCENSRGCENNRLWNSSLVRIQQKQHSCEEALRPGPSG